MCDYPGIKKGGDMGGKGSGRKAIYDRRHIGLLPEDWAALEAEKLDGQTMNEVVRAVIKAWRIGLNLAK